MFTSEEKERLKTSANKRLQDKLTHKTKPDWKQSRKEKAAKQMADALIEMCHIMYNKRNSMIVLETIVRRLDKCVKRMKDKDYANKGYRRVKHG